MLARNFRHARPASASFRISAIWLSLTFELSTETSVAESFQKSVDPRYGRRTLEKVDPQQAATLHEFEAKAIAAAGHDR
jgi:hypothetical protein